MKYWRGYLVAGILAAITWGVKNLAERFTLLVDMVYPYVARTLQTMLTQWSSSADYCLWQMWLIALVVIVVATIVLMIIFKWNPIQWFGWILTGASVIMLINTLVFGLVRYAGPISDDIRMEERKYTIEELADAAIYYRDKANELATQVERGSDGSVNFEDFETLAQKADSGFHSLVYDHSYSVFAGSTLPVKKLAWADLYTSRGTTGVTVGLTGEAAVNPNIPAVNLPFAMCREMCRRMCIVGGRDAAFGAFLACIANEDVQFRYSGYFMAYRYCYQALANSNNAEASAAAARVASGVGTELASDLQQYHAFFAGKPSESTSNLSGNADTVNFRTADGRAVTASYDRVCDLLEAWHYQQEILPTLVEQESRFDPFDEGQVDLTGIVNARAVPTPVEGGA